MTKVLARDLRKKAPSGANIEIEYDPANVQEFDTRTKGAKKWEETWGQKVDLEIEGEPCIFYLVHYSRSLTHINENRNILKNR